MTLPNSTVLGKKEFTKHDIENIKKNKLKSGVDKLMSIKNQKETFDTTLKVSFYIKAGVGKNILF